MHPTFRRARPLLALAAFLCAPLVTLHAATITRTNWTGSAISPDGPGQALGNIALGSGISVTYSGQLVGLTSSYPSWNPSSTFSGGTVGNAPPAANNAVQLTGGLTGVETIDFSSPVTNPVMAIWSLGQPGSPARFNFTSSEPFTIQAGGPSAEYGGQSITASGNSVLGSEGNGVVQFNGTYSEISFTTPTFENYYAFTVGAPNSGPPPTVTPEPGTFILLGTGILGLASRLRNRLG